MLAGILLKLGSYGALRILSLISGFSLKRLFGFWLLRATASRIVTFIQSDLKKLIAYRRVTHMTFMVAGIIAENKTTVIVILILSFSHGLAAIGLFSLAGTFSASANSRLGQVGGTETKLHWSAIFFGILLISNSSVPPFPSFFPEFILVIRIAFFFKKIFLFLIFSILVCYYNVYLFS